MNLEISIVYLYFVTFSIAMFLSLNNSNIKLCPCVPGYSCLIPSSANHLEKILKTDLLSTLFLLMFYITTMAVALNVSNISYDN